MAEILTQPLGKKKQPSDINICSFALLIACFSPSKVQKYI